MNRKAINIHVKHDVCYYIKSHCITLIIIVTPPAGQSNARTACLNEGKKLLSISSMQEWEQDVLPFLQVNFNLSLSIILTTGMN